MINAHASSRANAPLVDGKPVANALANSGSTELGAFELVEAQPAGVEQGPWLFELPVQALVEGAQWGMQGAAEPEVAEVEQWLSGMLAQQEVQLQAHDADVEPQGVLLAPLVADIAVKAVAMARELEYVAKPAATLPAQTPILPHVEQALGAPAMHASVQAVAPVVQVELPRVALPVAVTLEGLGLTTPALERLPLAEADAAPASLIATLPAHATPTSAAERTLRLHTPHAQWGEQMLHALREHVDLQINQRIQNATIRLDPPELGSLEIFLSHESGRLSVHLSAANSEVARLLHSTSERLRHELIGQNFMQVNVQVSADAQGGRQQGQQARAQVLEENVRAAQAQTQEAERSTSDSTGNVLVTV